MSFTRKNVVIASGRPAATSAVNRIQANIGTSSAIRGASHSTSASTKLLQHEGVKPSLVTSLPTISTGCNDLDKLLVHGGLPLGSLLLIEESGTTDFGSILLRSFASQGIVHSRMPNATAKTKVVVLSDENWGRELPDVYKGKKSDSSEKALDDSSTPSTRSGSNMKIAWRYSQQTNANSVTDSSKSNYNTVLDFTTRISPVASSSEAVYLTPDPTSTAFFTSMIQKLEIIARDAENSSTVVRVVVPSLLHPALYGPSYAQPQAVIPFLHCLQSLCRMFQSTLSIVITLPLELFPRESSLVRWIELIMDGVIHLEAFPEQLIPNPSENRAKTNQGLMHIYKLPTISQKGGMVRRVGEHAFRVERRQFEIVEFGIPVDEGESKASTPSSTDY